MSDELPRIRPMPSKIGVGFVSETKLPVIDPAKYPFGHIGNFRYEESGRYHNYHVTPKATEWPLDYPIDYTPYVIDGFSPNMNKRLHVGHLRNLAIASSLSRILHRHNAKFVALLGASLGVKKAAVVGWKRWTSFVGYRPKEYYDLTLPQDVIETRKPNEEELKRMYESSEIVGYPLNLPDYWDGPKGPVIVKRADGRPLYAFYDLLFAKEISPTHYITGHEQKGHFANLGFESKHLAMGLVLGSDGKKLKSRDGNALSANKALLLVMGNLRGVANAKKLAWNILSWNFLHAARQTDLKFEVEKWVRPEAPGMYITYTYARVSEALRKAKVQEMKPKNFPDYNEDDAKLVGFANQYVYYLQQAIQKMDPAPIAHFCLDLAKMLTSAYEREKIAGGREGFACAVWHANEILSTCMDRSGMFLLDSV